MHQGIVCLDAENACDTVLSISYSNDARAIIEEVEPVLPSDTDCGDVSVRTPWILVQPRCSRAQGLLALTAVPQSFNSCYKTHYDCRTA